MYRTAVKMLILMLLLMSVMSIQAQNRFINHLIPADYDSHRPPIEYGWVIVNTSITVHSFDATDNQLNLETDLTLCMKWYDRRILDFDISSEADTLPNENLTDNIVILTDYSRLWIPTVYFRNAMYSDVINGMQYVEVRPMQKILNYCSRLDVTFVCRFILSNFPFDEHYCRFELQTFGTSIPNVRLYMHHHIRSPTHNPQFRVRESLLGTCEPQQLDRFQQIFHSIEDRHNNQSCIYSGLRIVRHVNYYIIRYYLTTFLLVVISFVEFYYPTTAWPARTILTAVVLINIMGISRQVYDEVPCKDVASLYWWCWGCQMFVYFACWEFAVALAWVQFQWDKDIAHANNTESPDGHYFGKKSWYWRCSVVIERWLNNIVGPIPFHESAEGRNKVDYVARFLFPAVWLFYVLIYIVATIPAWAAKY